MSAAPEDAPDILSAALTYASMGWPIFPTQGKRPANFIRHWSQEATTDPATIAAWYAGTSGLGIGVHMGAAGLVAVDVDYPWHLSSEIQAILDSQPGVWIHQGNRERFSYVFTGHAPQTTGKDDQGNTWGEVKASGGYIVLAPSPHPDFDYHYQWLHTPGERPAEIPADLLPLIAPRTAEEGSREPWMGEPASEAHRNAAERLRTHLVAGLASTTEGRNIQANKVALILGHYVGHILDETETEALILEACKANGLVDDDGLSQTRKTVRSGLQAGMRQPQLPDVRSGEGLLFPPTPDVPGGNASDQERLKVWSVASLVLAEPLVAALAGQWLYGSGKFGWLRWDGRRWKRVDEDEVVEAAHRWLIGHINEMLDLGADPKQVSAIVSYLDVGRARNLVQAARTFPEMRVDPATLDQAYGFLNCANGTVDLATGELLAHDPAHLFTLVTEVDYVPGATSPDWDKAREAFADADSEAWVQRHFGGALTGLPGRSDVMAIHHGQGANGKSTILGTVQAAFGEFGGLLNDRILVGGPNEHQTIYMELRGKRLMVLEELPESHMLPIDRIKKLVDTPSITARGIGENPTTFPATHTLVISSNYVPVVRETDHGTWRRLVMIDYPHTFTGSAVDRTLRARLRKPKALQACLAWLVEGSVAWYAEGQGVPEATGGIEAATRAWRNDADVLGEYLEGRYEPGSPSDAILLQAVYEGFANHQEAIGERPWSYKLFSQRLRGHKWLANAGASVSVQAERWPGFPSPVRVVKNVKRKP